jgi:hypothetical protein
MDAVLARRPVAALDAEQERRWMAADDGGVTVLIGVLRRLLSELEQPIRAGQLECENGQLFDDLVAALDALIEKAEVLADREEDEAAGIEHRVQATTKVRPEHRIDRPRSSPVRTVLPACR